jgi:hypothetical protein
MYGFFLMINMFENLFFCPVYYTDFVATVLDRLNAIQLEYWQQHLIEMKTTRACVVSAVAASAH